MGLIKALPVFLLAAALLSYAAPAAAVVYQYFDEEGTLIVTDNPHRTKRSHTASSVLVPSVRTESGDGITYEYYPVTGRTFSEAVAAASGLGPFDGKEGRPYAGQTRWSAGWSYAFRSSCRKEGGLLRVSLQLTDIDFKSRLTVVLPSLAGGVSLGRHDSSLWEKFMKGLREHEADHVAIIRDPAYRDEAVRRLSSLRELVVPADPSGAPDDVIRQAVEAETARIGHEILKKIKARNDEYDRITEHGIKHEMRSAFFDR